MSGPVDVRAPSNRLQMARARSARICAKKLDAAAFALSEFLSACNRCRDGSQSLSLQGKGVDGRERLIADLREYSNWLDSKYGGER